MKLTSTISTIATTFGIGFNATILITSSVMVTSFVGSIAAIYYFSDDIKNIFNFVTNFFSGRDKTNTNNVIVKPSITQKHVDTQSVFNSPTTLTQSRSNISSVSNNPISVYNKPKPTAPQKPAPTSTSDNNGSTYVDSGYRTIIDFWNDKDYLKIRDKNGDWVEHADYLTSYDVKTIQTLFPLNEPSKNHDYTAYIKPEELDDFRKQVPDYEKKLQNHTDILINYFKENQIDVFNSKFKENNDYAVIITRISKSLRMFGMNKEARGFWNAINILSEKTEISKKTQDIWNSEKAEIEKSINLNNDTVKDSNRPLSVTKNTATGSSNENRKTNHQGLAKNKDHDEIISFWKDGTTREITYVGGQKHQTTRNEIIEFLEEDIRQKRSYDINGTNPAFGEVSHDFIQILFPTVTISRNHSSPIITEKDLSDFKTDCPNYDEILKEHLNVMMIYYNHYQKYIFKNGEYNHNYLRITRISESLRIFGLIEEVQIFWRQIDAFSKNITIPNETIKIWNEEKDKLTKLQAQNDRQQASSSYVNSDSGYERIIDCWNDVNKAVYLKDANGYWIDQKLRILDIIFGLKTVIENDTYNFSDLIQALFPVGKPIMQHKNTAYIELEKIDEFKQKFPCYTNTMNIHVQSMLDYYDQNQNYIFTKPLTDRHAMIITHISESLIHFNMNDKACEFWSKIDKLVKDNNCVLSNPKKTEWDRQKSKIGYSTYQKSR